MHKQFLITAVLLGALSVILGAFAAHSLKAMVSTEQLAVFETGVRYQFYHAFALLAVGMLYKEFSNKYLVWAGKLFCIGIIFFSGSLYCLTLFNGQLSASFKWLFLITPLGGGCFIAGWILMAWAIKQKR